MNTATPGTKPIHPNTAALLRFFDYYHLPSPDLRVVAKPFHDLAYDIVNGIGINGPEVTVCLRKLLEAKDCAVRAALPEGK